MLKSFCQKRPDGRVDRTITKTKAEHFPADLKTDFNFMHYWQQQIVGRVLLVPDGS
jgi:hypothetical protein